MTALRKHEPYPDSYHGVYSRTIFGFWLYLLSDFMLFGTMFATYLVLKNNTFGGPGAQQLFNIHYTTIQTLILLFSTLTIGLGGASAHRNNKNNTLIFFAMTFLLGIIFIWMQFDEFIRIYSSGNTWIKSAFLSIYFSLIGTHTLHVLFAILWIPILIIPVLKNGIHAVNIKRLTCLRMFWQFLNIIWIFIFSIVYVLGVI